ncbi:MAG: protein-L-isoaspartate O-methyltransferase family protein, partial [Rhodanobacteraceae bacterium]
VVPLKTANGVALSTVSQPTMIALMLEQLQVTPRARTLEIGSGSGYNAALLAELTGPEGSVVTVEIDPDIAAIAASNLARAGYGGVRTVCNDGRAGEPHYAPYDRIIVTACAPSLSSALCDQLRPGGRIVAPIGNPERQRSAVFENTPSGLRETGAIACKFVPLRKSSESSS